MPLGLFKKVGKYREIGGLGAEPPAESRGSAWSLHIQYMHRGGGGGKEKKSERQKKSEFRQKSEKRHPWVIDILIVTA